jgi:hypothetical protein
MDPKVKKAWVKALRSGKYAQGKNTLARRKPHGKTQYCCLGVLCDVTGVPRKGDTFLRGASITYVFGQGVDQNEAFVPYSIGEKLGLPRKTQDVLALMNDDENKNFNEIADYIEKEL